MFAMGSSPYSGNAGLDLLLRWFPSGGSRKGLFLDVGTGAAYTPISFEEQGTHFLRILVGGIGLRYDTLFIEDRFSYYPNGYSVYPNRPVNTNVISVGKRF